MDSREAPQQPALPLNMMLRPNFYPYTMPTSNISALINPNSISMMPAGRGFPFNSMPHSPFRPLGDGIYHESPVFRPCGVNIELPKKKRGRPRKYAQEGSIALGLERPPISGGEGSRTPSGEPPKKRRRGRPQGSVKKQLDAMGTTGTGWTPHVIKVEAGEDITSKIMAFSQQGPRVVCVLSATGTICNVTLRKGYLSSDAVNYEGAFNIISLSGCFSFPEDDDSNIRTSGLNILFGGPDNSIIGGGVAGRLIAATSVQVIVGSFTVNGKKTNSPISESGPSSAPPPNMSNFGAPSMAESPKSRRVSSESSGENGRSPLNQMHPGVHANASQTMQHMQMYQYGMSRVNSDITPD